MNFALQHIDYITLQKVRQSIAHKGAIVCHKNVEAVFTGALQSMEQCTMGKLQWEFGNRNFSIFREKYIWNIWTRIKWEAKLTNVSELFGRC